VLLPWVNGTSAPMMFKKGKGGVAKYFFIYSWSNFWAQKMAVKYVEFLSLSGLFFVYKKNLMQKFIYLKKNWQ